MATGMKCPDCHFLARIIVGPPNSLTDGGTKPSTFERGFDLSQSDLVAGIFLFKIKPGPGRSKRHRMFEPLFHSPGEWNLNRLAFPAERIFQLKYERWRIFKSQGLKFREDGKRYEAFLELLNKHSVRYCVIFLKG